MTAQVSEQFIENLTSQYFRDAGVAVQGSAEVDSAGERSDPSGVILKGRLAAALGRLNPGLPPGAIEDVARHPSRTSRTLH